jgi:cytochrome c-type biogenesis protein CcmH/NrfF
MTASRREFLQRASWAMLPMALQLPQGGGRGVSAADTLPYQVGADRRPIGPLDNDPGVIAIERRLRCSCGCTLDVYTCRTTDFSCTYSPRMHAIVVAKVQEGQGAQQILDWFVAQPEDEYGGHKALMAPPPSGFNLMGYLLPGVLVVTLGIAIVLWLTRRGLVPARVDGGLMPDSPLDAEQQARLKRALDDVES